jgi:hypothetical protein
MKTARAKQRTEEVSMIMWENNEPEIREFIQNDRLLKFPDERLLIWNMENNNWMNVPPGHWVIKGVKDELNTVSPELKERLYEDVVE